MTHEFDSRGQPEQPGEAKLRLPSSFGAGQEPVEGPLDLSHMIALIQACGNVGQLQKVDERQRSQQWTWHDELAISNAIIERMKDLSTRPINVSLATRENGGLEALTFPYDNGAAAKLNPLSGTTPNEIAERWASNVAEAYDIKESSLTQLEREKLFIIDVLHFIEKIGSDTSAPVLLWDIDETLGHRRTPPGKPTQPFHFRPSILQLLRYLAAYNLNLQQGILTARRYEAEATALSGGFDLKGLENLFHPQHVYSCYDMIASGLSFKSLGDSLPQALQVFSGEFETRSVTHAAKILSIFALRQRGVNAYLIEDSELKLPQHPWQNWILSSGQSKAIRFDGGHLADWERVSCSAE